MDFIVGLTPTKHGHDAVFVCVDKLSKMTHFMAITTTMTAEETTRLFRDHVYKLHGIPLKLISDRDARFAGRFWQELHYLLGIQLAMSTSFHPQTDHETERLNRVFENMLRHYVSHFQNDWDKYLSMVEFAFNNSWQKSIKTTHFLLNYGQHPSTLVNRMISGSQILAIKDFTLAMGTVISEAKKHLLAVQQRQKSYADTKQRDVSYEVGSEVLLSYSNIKLKTLGARKLLPR